MAGVPLLRSQAVVDRQPVLANEMGDDRVAVADRLCVVDDVGQLAARRRGGIENVLMPECQPGEPQKGEDLEAIRVVVGNAKQLGIGIKGEHGASTGLRKTASNAASWPGLSRPSTSALRKQRRGCPAQGRA